jgi:hypothetical protein
MPLTRVRHEIGERIDRDCDAMVPIAKHRH